MKYIELFEVLTSNTKLIDYISRFNIKKVKLPFSEKKYNSFSAGSWKTYIRFKPR